MSAILDHLVRHSCLCALRMVTEVFNGPREFRKMRSATSPLPLVYFPNRISQCTNPFHRTQSILATVPSYHKVDREKHAKERKKIKGVTKRVRFITPLANCSVQVFHTLPRSSYVEASGNERCKPRNTPRVPSHSSHFVVS